MFTLKDFILPALAVIDIGTAIWLVQFGPFPLVVDTGASTAYLNVYVHVPGSVALYVAATLALIAALLRRIRIMDFSAYATAALGWFAFITGTIWAAESWGSALALDPRQMSVLVFALIYSIYPAVKRGVEDPERRERLARIYIAAGYALAVLSLIAPYLATSFHPRPGTTMEGPLGAYMGLRILIALAVFAALAAVRPPRFVAYIYLAGIAASLVLLYPWFFYSPVRVVNVTTSSIGLADGRVLDIKPSAVLSPAFVNNTPTLVGNFVALIGGVPQLVRHYSAYVNLALYCATMSLLVEVRRRL
ncbi:MAG: cytochrome C biogenesis protein [Thermoproteus sp.]